MNTPLQQAARAMIDRWDSTDWKDTPHTAHYVAELRKALDAELQQSVEPMAWIVYWGQGLARKNSIHFERKTADLAVSEIKSFQKEVRPVYLHPPQPQATTPRKPLTDDQVINAMCEDGCERIESFYFAGPVQKAAVWSFARAIEAALLKAQGEKP